MAGLIHPEDLETVRERSRIEDVVGASVQLRPAGGGALVGLCPFHDEKTPSFRVTPSKGFYYCFGCGEGGDVISFVQKINNMGFTEAVEYLADRVGLQLRYTEGDGAPRHEPGLRMRVLEANQLAAEFFARQLSSPDAVEGRVFLDQRGFTREHAEHFGIGFAPRGGRDLLTYLLEKKFTKDLGGLLMNQKNYFKDPEDRFSLTSLVGSSSPNKTRYLEEGTYPGMRFLVDFSILRV